MDEGKKKGITTMIPRCTTLIKKAKSADAKVISVIRVNTHKGAGTPDDMCRIISEYWSLDGELLAVHDPINEDYDCEPFDE